MISLNPSSVARRVKCPGSYKLEQPFKNVKSDQAQEGIAAHWVATLLAKNPNSHIPEFTPDSVEITEEMIEGARLYAGFIHGHFKDSMQLLKFEEELRINSISPYVVGRPDCWGMLTVIDLHLYEYKFGHGFVEVYENWQLIEYVAGILEYLNVNGVQDQNLKVHMHVIQPRSFHPEGQIRTWHIRASDLRAYFNKLREVEHNAVGDSPITSVSSECGNCSARHICKTLQNSAMVGLDVVGSAVPHNLLPEQLATELRVLSHYRDILDSRISGLSAEALALIQRGERVPYFQAVRGRGRDRWTKPQEEIIALASLYGVDVTNVKLITPKQAIDAGLDEKQVKSVSETPMGALKLMPVDTRKTDRIFGVDND